MRVPRSLASDFNPNDNTDSATVNVNPEADLSLTKTASNPNPAVDDEVDYTLTASNAGPNDATGVTIQDSLPAGLDFIDASPGCDNENGTVKCDVGTIATGATASVTIRTHTTAAVAGMSVGNLATVSGNEQDPTPANNQAAATITVQPLVDLELKKVASNPAPAAGGPVSYSLTLLNNGPSPATGVTITDPLPTGLSFGSATPGQGSCSASGQTVTCNLGTLAAGGTALVTITADVAASATGTTLKNTASASANEPIAQPELTSSEASITPVAKADLSLTKTASNPNPAVDDEVDYTLTASNAGPNDATGVTIQDSLPAGLDFIDASPGCDNENGTVKCDVGTIATGATASVTIRTHTTAAVAGMSVGNLATVSGNEQDPTPANNQAAATITVQPLVDLELKKVASNPAPAAGGPVSYSLTLLNNGPSPATGVTITDPLPTGLSFGSATPGQGSCSASGQTVTCNLGTLAAGGTALVTITADVAASTAGTTLKNTASASANEPIAQPELTRSEASITPVAKPPPAQADLALVKTVNHTTGRTGEPLTYTITVRNHGPDTASSPTVTDAFSAPVTLVSVHTSSGSCSKGHPITCRLDSIASGASDKITIVAKPTSTGELRNSASVRSATPDPDGANNLSHVTTMVRPGPAALRLTKTASRHTVAPGQTFSFTIAVHSLGPEPALRVQVCDRLGSGMAFISVDHATFRHGSACWKISSLAKGKARRYVVKVRALALAIGARRLTNVATTSAEDVRTRTARASVTVAAPPARPVGVTG